MQIEWSKEEWAILKRANGGRASDEAAHDLAGCAVSLFLSRASGQVAEDLRVVERLVPKDAAISHAALARLAALAQEVESLRATNATSLERISEMERLANARFAEAEALRLKVGELERGLMRILDECNAEPAHEAHLLDAAIAVVASQRERVTDAEEERNEARAEVERERERADSLHRTWQRVERELKDAESRLAVIRGFVQRALATGQYMAQTLAGLTHHPALKAGGHVEAHGQICSDWADVAASLRGWLNLKPVLEGDAPQEAKCPTHPEDGACEPMQSEPWRCVYGEHAIGGGAIDRHPCSDTCTHDDSATPGHPERVRERSGAVNSITFTRNELDNFRHDAEEAMRAACLADVLEMYRKQGGCVSAQDLKAAIEGATP